MALCCSTSTLINYELNWTELNGITIILIIMSIVVIITVTYITIQIIVFNLKVLKNYKYTLWLITIIKISILINLYFQQNKPNSEASECSVSQDTPRRLRLATVSIPTPQQHIMKINSKWNAVSNQQGATVLVYWSFYWSIWICSTCFGRQTRPSSGTFLTLTAAISVHCTKSCTYSQ